ncbi:MAG: thermonuclease family protein, partial [Thermodesulfovibrionaceae bacterium]
VNFIILPLILLFLATCSKKDNDLYKVVSIHDGDTISITIKSFLGISLKTEKVRLIGIDAPEIEQKPWGIKAKNHLKKLIKESDWLVRLEFDIQHKDRYGRLLAYVWDKNGKMVNYMMVRDGYAVLYTVPPNVKYVNLLINAQRLARQEGKGIWGKDGLKELPSEWRERYKSLNLSP